MCRDPVVDSVLSKLVLRHYIEEPKETEYWKNETNDFVGQIFICSDNEASGGTVTLATVAGKTFFITNVHIFTRDRDFSNTIKIKSDIEKLKKINPRIIISMNGQIFIYTLDKFFMYIGSDIAIAQAPLELQSKLQLISEPPFEQNTGPFYYCGFTHIGFCQSRAKITSIDKLTIESLGLAFSGFSGGPLFFVQNNTYYLLGITCRVSFNTTSIDQEITSASYYVIFRLIERLELLMQLLKKSDIMQQI